MKKKEINDLKTNYFLVGFAMAFFIFSLIYVFFILVPSLTPEQNKIYEKICYPNYDNNETIYWLDGTEDCIYDRTRNKVNLSEAECLVSICPFGSYFLDGSHVCYDDSKSYGIVDEVCVVWKLNDTIITN